MEVCQICNKQFTSKRKYSTHLKSKVHKKQLERYERECAHDEDCPVKSKCSVINCDWCNCNF
jgi:hypothetical protein